MQIRNIHLNILLSGKDNLAQYEVHEVALSNMNELCVSVQSLDIEAAQLKVYSCDWPGQAWLRSDQCEHKCG